MTSTGTSTRSLTFLERVLAMLKLRICISPDTKSGHDEINGLGVFCDLAAGVSTSHQIDDEPRDPFSMVSPSSKPAASRDSSREMQWDLPCPNLLEE